MIRLSEQIRFILLFLGLYLFFSWCTLFWIGITSKGNLYWPFADEHLNFVNLFRRFLLGSAKTLCTLLGYETSFSGEYGLRVGTTGIRLVYSCLGFGVMSFYAAFILAWPAPAFIRNKAVALVLGTSLITFLNIVRLSLLPVIHMRYPVSRNFPVGHHEVFNTILYIVIAGMLYSWTQHKKEPLIDNR